MGSVLGFPGVDPSDAAVGARLRRWREQRGMSVDDLAPLLHLSAEETRRAQLRGRQVAATGLGAATHALRLPLWALASDVRAY